MLKNLILIENGEKYQFDDLKELVKTIIDPKYYEMSEEEKREKLELKAFANCMQENIEIITKFSKGQNIDKKFIAIDEVSYIYSLLLLNKVMLLEKTKVDILTRHLEKRHIAENYLIVNHFAKELLEKYLAKLS